MNAHPPPIPAAAPLDLVESARSPLAILYGAVRNPIRSLPDETFRHAMVRSRFGRQVRLYLCDPALVHDALVRNADALSKGRISRRVLAPALGNGLLTAEGADWRRQRQSVAAAFQHAKLQAFLPAMITAALETRDRWLSSGAGGGVVDIGHEMMMTTFAIIVETMLSGPDSIDAARVERDVAVYLGSTGWSFAIALLGAPAWLPYPGRRRALAAAADMRGMVVEMVAQRRRAAPRTDLVSLLLAARDAETGQAMSDEAVADNLLTFMTAGHETTAQGLTWTFHLLARHPEVEAAVLAEIERVTDGGDLRPEHVEALVYTRQVVSEAMRLYPPAPLVTRTVDEPFDLAGYAVPRDATLIVPIYAIHRHTAVWSDPERFDPDRFAPDQVRARHRLAYMPFGAGPRICIGSAFAMMEAVVILAVLLRTFHVRDAGQADPQPTMKVTLRPVRPIRMRVDPR